MIKQKITIYTTSEFFGSVVKREGHLVEHGRKQYAQYNDAPYVKYIPKRARKVTGFVKTYKPYLVICDGWNCPEPDDMFGEAVHKEGTTISKSIYRSFDDKYKTDFDQVLENSDVKIIADYRENVSQSV